ncbi:hypothetical protein HPB47_015815 [Ixodes persulcatus]|uniref:Uncharacterized protein n=1 Tax=Ixodes persulcatus TaxID=34615 RepID=A0AC60QUH1_IXOPE|nr:hypothetical protein HPB47_015815 [Ixodes persulcatus]
MALRAAEASGPYSDLKYSVPGDRHAGACVLSGGCDNSLNFDAMDTSPHGPPHEGYTALSTQKTTMDINELSSQPNEDEGWQSVTRRRARRVKPEQLRLERVSRPHFSLAIGPLHKVSIHAIPKQALTGAIEGTAPNRSLADMATYRLDTRANTIRVTITDKEHEMNLAARKRLFVEISKQIKTFEVEIERAPTTKPTGGRGVIKVRPDHTLDYIKDHIRCETATILDLKLLGKSEMLLITFDTPEIPTRLAFDYEIVRVYPYRQKLIACYNCHQLEHPGHISLNAACPSRIIPQQNQLKVPETRPKSVSWADTLMPQGKVAAQQPPILPEFQRQLDELRKENKELKEQLRLLMSQMAGKHLKETEDYASATSDPNQPWRGSRSRRSPTRKSTVSSQGTSLLREDSRYTQVLDILRQDRTNDRRMLERLVSDKI